MVTAPAIGNPDFDALTGLPNRARFQALLPERLAEAARSGAELALIILDIDRFTQVNHLFGHRGGDALLLAASRRLANILRDGDFLARLDGDTFAVAASFQSDARAAAAALAQLIVDRFQEGFPVGGTAVRASATVGVALAPAHAATAETLQRFAELGLHAGKAAGGNRVCIFDEQTRFDLESRWKMDNRLRDAVEAGEITVCHQPIIDLGSERIVGVEALARWRHAVLGVVAPDRFIQAAEENHLIRELGGQVLARACRDARDWIHKGAIDFLSVNLSPIQMQNGDDARAVLATLADHGVDPSTLVLEVTERLMLLDSPDVLPALETLRAWGARLALDDFGVGFSNLSCLNRFAVDRIKIDRSLIADIDTRRSAGIIVQSVIDLAHHLGLQVIAEGVETAAQTEMLARMGCDYGQGFWFSPALPAAEMDALLRRGT